MKRKIYFILSSLRAGGSEKVFWLLSQGFNKSIYEITIVLLDSQDSWFSTEIDDVKVIDLKTKKASLSFFKLSRLLVREKPFAVFSTGGQVNTLVGFISFFINIRLIIARPTNVAEKEKFLSVKGKLLSIISERFFQRFDFIICQSEEIKRSFSENNNIQKQKLVIIPNPVLPTEFLRDISNSVHIKRLIVVARLTKQKGLHRLLDLFKDLPLNYTLTIVGDGPLKNEILVKIAELNIRDRIDVLGRVSNVTELMSQHTVCVLSSFIEGFPNVVVEALSVGTPVVSFEVGGINEIIRNDFNGYIVKQDDKESFKECITKACNKTWDSSAIKKDINNRFGINKVVVQYEKLIN